MSLPILTRQTDLGAKRKTVRVDVPDLGCSVILRELSIGQLKGIENDLPAQLALMIIGEDGKRIYNSIEDVKALSELSAAAGTFLMKEAARLNGISQEAMDAALKNSPASLSNASATA